MCQVTEEAPMILSEEFLRHANECQSTARFSRDPSEKAAWKHMAERWARCAERAREHDQLLFQVKRKLPAQERQAE